jgi:hypothetical protein
MGISEAGTGQGSGKGKKIKRRRKLSCARVLPAIYSRLGEGNLKEVEEERVVTLMRDWWIAWKLMA